MAAYYWTVLERAGLATGAFLKTHVLASLAVSIITAIVTGWAGAGVGERFNVGLTLFAAVAAPLLVTLVVLVYNFVAEPARMHQELLVRLQASERRPDVDRLVHLLEDGLQLLRQQVPIVERAYHTDEELRAVLAADNQELLVFQMKLRWWEDETAAELEKCAAKSEVSSFKTSEREVLKNLGLITVREFPGFTAAIDQEKAMLRERLERLRAVIRRVEGIG